MDTYTIKQVANHIGVSEATIRLQWGPEFADYLSDEAVPPKGVTRRYTDDDIAVLMTVAVMRDQDRPFDDIAAALADGKRLDRPDDQKPPLESPRTAENAPEMAIVTKQFSDTLRSFESRLDAMRDKNQELNDQLREATNRAAELATRLGYEEKQAAEEKKRADRLQSELDRSRRPWWKKITGQE